MTMENTGSQGVTEQTEGWKNYVRRLAFTHLTYEVCKSFKHAKMGTIWRITNPNTFYLEYIDGFIMTNIDTERVIEIVYQLDEKTKANVEELDDGEGAYGIYDFPFFLKHFRWLQDYDDHRDQLAGDKLRTVVPESSPKESHNIMMNCA